MPIDAKRTVPVLVHLDPEEWEKFKAIAGHRRASYRLRSLMRSHNARIQNAIPQPTRTK